MKAFALFSLTLLLVLPVSAQELSDELKAALDNPAATGLLVVQIVPGSQAAGAGFRVGDVLVSYDGKETRSVPGLNELKAAAADKDSVPVVLVRGAAEVVFELAPGQIGVQLVPVTKGAAVQTLPPATDVRFDFSALDEGPMEGWYAFYLGPEKVGFEYFKLSKAPGKVLLHREVAFDGGDQWGLNHFDVFEVLGSSPRPHVLVTRFTTPIDGWSARGRMSRTGTGWSWSSTLPPENPGATPVEVSYREEGEPVDLIPSYFVESLAVFMPREKGACYHYRSVANPGTVEEENAFLCVGREKIAYGGAEIDTFKYENRAFPGRVTMTVWVDGTGRVVRSDYGGAVAVLTSKEAALQGLNPEIEPRSK